MEPVVFLQGRKVSLRKLVSADINQNYLSWLNDPEVLHFSRRKAFPTGMEALQRYYEDLQSSGDLHLAICLKRSGKHIGNISLNSINWLHRSAELSIMIGDKSEWGKGAASDAMEAITQHAFLAMNLHRIWAESPNPGFNKAVARLGWKHEGTKREAFFADGELVDVQCYAVLKDEWMRKWKK